MAPYLAFFAAGRFRIGKGVRDGQPWLVAVSEALPTRRAAARDAADAADPADHRAGSRASSAPTRSRPSGGLVTSLEPGFALENQTRPTYSPASLTETHRRPRARAPVVRRLGRRCDHWSDIWLNEGAATFMEWRWGEAAGGRAGGAAAAPQLRHHRRRRRRSGTTQVADPCPSRTGCVNRIFAGFVYQRGAMALQALRNRIGEDDFSALLRRWVADREGGNGSTAQFEALAEEVSGEDLDGFFAAWLHSGDQAGRHRGERARLAAQPHPMASSQQGSDRPRDQARQPGERLLGVGERHRAQPGVDAEPAQRLAAPSRGSGGRPRAAGSARCRGRGPGRAACGRRGWWC